MNFEKLGEHLHIPKNAGKPLVGKENIKFNYYLNSRVYGKRVDLDITTKLFLKGQCYVRKGCYRVRLGEIEECVKYNLLDHKRSLGMDED